MPATDNHGIVTVSGGGELTTWAQRLKKILEKTHY